MEQTKGAYKTRIIKEYIKHPFDKAKNNPTFSNVVKIPLIIGAIEHFKLSDSEKKQIQLIEKDFLKATHLYSRQSEKSQYKQVLQRLDIFVQTIHKRELL